MRKFLIAAVATAITVPGWANCAGDGVLATVERVLRQNYFQHDPEDEPPRPLKLTAVRATDYNEHIDKYTCAATLQFKATFRDLMVRKNLKQTGDLAVPVRYEVTPDATNRDENIVSVYGIPMLKYEL